MAIIHTIQVTAKSSEYAEEENSYPLLVGVKMGTNTIEISQKAKGKTTIQPKYTLLDVYPKNPIS